MASKTRRDAAPKVRDLTRAKVVAATLRLIDGAGADAVTMRGVAEAVGVTPMALYNHFSSKGALLAAVAESVIAAADFDGGQGPWRERILHCFCVVRRLCLEHPGLPRLLEVDGAVPVAAFAPMEVALRALRESGLDDVDATRTYFLLMGYTLTQAAYQTRRVPELEPSEDVRAERIAGRGYPSVERLDIPAAWDFDASFAFGISLIIAGVEATVAGRGMSGKRIEAGQKSRRRRP
ncbi:MAG: TetR/AcrR family transcriptional regulator [Rhizobiaceae bacterium]